MTSNPQPTLLKDNYLTIKLAMITLVGLAFFIASYGLDSTIRDRKSLLYKAKENIALAWAGPQTIIGPVLIIPYTDDLKKDKVGRMIFAPSQLNANGMVTPEIRRRGIFDVLVYQSELELTCKFLAIKQYQIANKTIHWDQAKVALFVKDIKGLNKVTLKINNSDIHVQSSSTVSFKGVHAPLTSINQNEPLNVTFNINIKGSESLSLLPIAKENKIELCSNWPDPSFTGQFLPNTKNVTKQGFEAQWAISSYATSLNESFDVEELNTNGMFDQKLGVRFLKTADHYQQAERTSKYSFLFVLYTFLLFFLYEVVKKTKIHIFQYFITACSLLCFSVLLTAFAEHAPFEVAYGVSSLAIISQIAFYAFGILHKKSERMIFVSLLISIYLYLFIVLRLEEIAFLIGAIGMFLAITAAMYCTKNIKWFEREV